MNDEIEEDVAVGTDSENDEAEAGGSEKEEKEDDGKPPFFDPKKILITQAVLIELRAKAVNGKPERVVWKSRLANCASSCRPLRVCFQKEDKTVVKREFKRVKDEIAQMERYSPQVEKKDSNIGFDFRGLSTLFT